MPKDLPQPIQTERSVQASSKRGLRRVARKPASGRVISEPDQGAVSRLRLVGTGAPDTKPPTANPTPITSPTDPRWVLAIRTAQVMEDTVLPPTKRDVLMREGKSMGLSAFDCSLILAIIQDRARRGIPLDDCPTQAESQLALIPQPTTRSFQSALGENPARTIVLAAGLLMLQGLLIWVWLG